MYIGLIVIPLFIIIWPLNLVSFPSIIALIILLELLIVASVANALHILFLTVIVFKASI